MKLLRIILEDEKIHYYYDNGSIISMDLLNKAQFEQALRFVVIEFNNKIGSGM